MTPGKIRINTSMQVSIFTFNNPVDTQKPLTLAPRPEHSSRNMISVNLNVSKNEHHHSKLDEKQKKKKHHILVTLPFLTNLGENRKGS